MEREEAIAKVSKLIGQDLRELAKKYNVTVFKNGKKNKGWAGHVIERYLELPLNSSQSPNFGSWELKTNSLKYLTFDLSLHSWEQLSEQNVLLGGCTSF